MDDEKITCEHSMDCHSASSPRTKNRPDKLKNSLIVRLNRVEGQVRGIKGMIEKDAYCDDILNQISSVQAAMKSISKLVLESHMRGCVIERVQSGDNDVVDELLDTIGKML